MAFMKETTIYQNKDTRVYINQCYNKGKKTNLYAVRSDNKRAYGELIGIIKFDGGWRQYVLFPEPNTKWSAGCKEAISKFEREITNKWRNKLRRKK